MLEQGAPLDAIQEILGHSNIETTRKVYALTSPEKARADFDKYTVKVANLMCRKETGCNSAIEFENCVR